jgi:alpha-beta hydrolase superfamily lysophospholipase
MHDHMRMNMSDGASLHVYRWLPDSRAEGVVLAVHGMGEHGGRYARFAERMCEGGLAVYAHDQRGHGRTAGAPERLGHIADENGWERLVDDIREVIAAIRADHPGLPLFLLGHSMGSLLARRYIQRFGAELSGVVLIATGGDPGLAGRFGLTLALRGIRRHGARIPSRLLQSILFGTFNRRFRPRRTGFEWLNRDEREVDNYLRDPWVAKSYSFAFFRDLIGGTIALHQPHQFNATRRDLPMLFLSGDQDPLGGFAKNVVRIRDRYLAIGCTDVTLKLYPGARHELLQEQNREEVYADILAWIRSRM